MIEEDGCQEVATRVGDFFMKELMSLRDDYEVVGDVRGKGLMLAMELVVNKVRLELNCSSKVYIMCVCAL